MYLIIQKLSHSIKYKKENSILGGLIPRPKEPKFTMNSYLQPLVTDLKKLWPGVYISCADHPLKVFTRAALTYCMCDIPATHSKCNKEFPSFENAGSGNKIRRNFSGSDREDWPSRSLLNHRVQAYNHLNAKTIKKEKFIEIRYSVLLELPYWDPIKFLRYTRCIIFFRHWKAHYEKAWQNMYQACSIHKLTRNPGL